MRRRQIQEEQPACSMEVAQNMDTLGPIGQLAHKATEFFSPKRQKTKDLQKSLKKISENKEAKKKENWKENNK